MSLYCDNVACPEVQAGLAMYFDGQRNPAQILEAQNTLRFLVDDVNAHGFVQNAVAPGDGKIRSVILTWKQRKLESSVSDTSIASCDGGPKPCKKSEVYTLDPDDGVSHEWSVDFSDLRKDCDSNGMWMAEELASNMDLLIRRMNTRVIEQLSLLRGNFASTGSANPISVRTRKSGEPDVISQDIIRQVLYQNQENEGWSIPFLFGSGELAMFMNEIKSGCCAANLGIDLGDYVRRPENDMMFLRDRKIETEFGSNRFLMLNAGAVQVLKWNEFEGDDNVHAESTYSQGTLIHPLYPNIVFDYLAQHKCANKWNLQLKLAFKTVGVPDDIYRVGDRLRGVTWVNEFEIDNS